MQERPRSKGPNLSSLIGWAIFVLVIAGGPLLRTIQGALGSAVNLAAYIPYAVAALVLLSVVVSAAQAYTRARPRREPTLGRDLLPPASQPMPPFGGDTPAPRIPDAPIYPPAPRIPDAPIYPPAPHVPSGPTAPAASRVPPAPTRASRSGEMQGLPRAPQFEPLFPPGVLAIGVIGLVILGGAALFVFGAGAP